METQLRIKNPNDFVFGLAGLTIIILAGYQVIPFISAYAIGGIFGALILRDFVLNENREQWEKLKQDNWIFSEGFLYLCIHIAGAFFWPIMWPPALYSVFRNGIIAKEPISRGHTSYALSEAHPIPFLCRILGHKWQRVHPPSQIIMTEKRYCCSRKNCSGRAVTDIIGNNIYAGLVEWLSPEDDDGSKPDEFSITLTDDMKFDE
jgi:hypothetical protein